jgi:hypothetical protein
MYIYAFVLSYSYCHICQCVYVPTPCLGNLDGQNNSSSQNLVALSEQTDSNVDEHPFSIGHQLVATYRDGSHRLAKIIER